MFEVDKSKNTTETDYLARLWVPLFEILLSAGNNIIRLKSGESVSVHSRAAKRMCYNEKGHVIAFKIDIRFVVEYKSVEYDVGAGELAKFFPDDIKLFGDECKLIREGKEVVDTLVNIYNGESSDRDPVGYVIQMNGPNAEIASVHLPKPYLYVAVPESKVYIPKSIATLAPFLETLNNLLIFKTKMEKNAQHILNSLENIEARRISVGGKFGRPTPSTTPSYKATWT
ncbi:hypothetical protein INT45_006996 [Circinella minor]|uniref:Uncharacterized protein n=1 Tax=Circinella minor TaxID=1195481 RepID=A0A8H7S5T0_9FUNG|nr:hypothetical protein INT45_006996 [Circinella minor]